MSEGGKGGIEGTSEMEGLIGEVIPDLEQAISEGGSGGLEPSPEVGYVKAGKTAVTIAQMSGKTRLNGLSRFSSNWEVKLIGG